MLAAQQPATLDGLKQLCKTRGLALFPISAHSGEGIEVLKLGLINRLNELRDGPPAWVDGEGPGHGVEAPSLP